MTRRRPTRTRPRRPRRAFTIVETVISMVLVAVLYVAVLRTLGASAAQQQATVERGRGHLLAQALMTEIVARDYEEATNPVMGREAGEAEGVRSAYDDVDDYAGWTSSPPEDAGGDPVPNTTGWTRSATVVWVDPADLSQASASETGVKRITVDVWNGDRHVAWLTAVRTDAR